MFINVCTKYKLLSPHFDVQPPTPFPRFTKLVYSLVSLTHQIPLPTLVYTNND